MELYKNFVPSKTRKSYENAALLAQAAGKRLVYVIGTDHDDRVNQISDLKHWSNTIKNQSFSAHGWPIRCIAIKSCTLMSVLFLSQKRKSAKRFGPWFPSKFCGDSLNQPSVLSDILCWNGVGIQIFRSNINISVLPYRYTVIDIHFAEKLLIL